MIQQTMHIQGPQINQFNNIAPAPIPRSAFRRDFTRRTTFNADFLVPIFVDEILPGDEVNISMVAQTRMATPIKPVMENLYQETFWFYIPNRIVWPNWEKLQGEQNNPGDSVAYLTPVLDATSGPVAGGFAVESIFDYYGLPIGVTPGIQNINSLYFRAYNMIWNEWFRNENIQSSLPVPTGDGPDDANIYGLQRRNKRKDYFTSMLPWPQKGDPVTINLGGSAPVTIVGNGNTPAVISDQPGITQRGLYTFRTGASTPTLTKFEDTNAFGTVQSWPARWYDTGMTGTADLSAASGITINALRQAALYQQILELDARGGTRYVESIYSRFGVISPDFRLQRPELIGQGSTRINVYAVPQTAASTNDSPQGNLAAFGTSTITGGHGCRYSATEHGMIIGLMNVRADLTYQQGIPRMFTRRSRLDYYEPLLNGLGEQVVFSGELFARGGINDRATAGYQERFAEYRFKNSEITGKFRSDAAQSLDIWHLAQDFAALPSLNSQFIQSDTPMERVLAVTDESDFLSDISFTYNHVRPMPIRSNPGITRL